MTGTDHLRCVVERTTYQSSETGFAVLQCRAKGYPELVTVVGNMPEVHSGSVLTLEGAWKMDARYGRQFTVIKFEEALPTTVYGIVWIDIGRRRALFRAKPADCVENRS